MSFLIVLLLVWLLVLHVRLNKLGRAINRLEAGEAQQERHRPWTAPPGEPQRYPHAQAVRQASSAPIAADRPAESGTATPQAPPVIAGTAALQTGARTAAVAADWEQRFGVRLSVWLGGIALAFAGVYLVRYSLENDLLSPLVRVWSGVIAGLALLLVADWLRRRPTLANGERITQALSGAGVVVLYASVYAAAGLYDMIPPLAGFLGMAAVTFIAVFLSFRYGPPIALLGLLGGFATPALLSSDSPSVAALFIYLQLLFGGLMLVMQRQGWWLLALLAVLVGFTWVPLWLLLYWSDGDGLWVGLFLVGACAVLAWTAARHADTAPVRPSVAGISTARAVSYAGFGAALLLMTLVVNRAGYGAMEWLLLGLLAAGTLLLAWGRPEVYRIAPFASLAVVALLLLWWPSASAENFAVVIASATLLYAGGSLLFLRWSRQTLLWSLLLCAAIYALFMVAWIRQSLLFGTLPADWVWGLGALLLCAAVLGLMLALQPRLEADRALAQRVQALYILTATALFTSGAAIVLAVQWWLPVLAAELLAVVWISGRTTIPFLDTLTRILLVLVALVALPVSLVTGIFVFDSLVYFGVGSSAGAEFLARDPLFQFVASGVLILLAGADLKARDVSEGTVVRWLDWAGIALLVLGSYYVLREVALGSDWYYVQTAGFTQRGAFSLWLLVLAVAALWWGRRRDWTTYSLAGACLALLAFARVLYFDLLVMNPWWSGQQVPGWPVLNMLWLNYATPILAIALCRHLLMLPHHVWPQHTARYLSLLALLLLFGFVTLQVRHFYHGEQLSSGTVSNAEIYTYSVTWLLTGLLILGWGVLRQNPLFRYASLAVLLLAVGKVFLYDASQLEGLYRVASFLGLGLCLIGLSWFYSRFVFRQRIAQAT